jgi:hypothetical protein
MSVLTLAATASCGIAANAQDRHTTQVGNVQIQGLPDDWSHHRLIFSNPGSEEDAYRDGTHDHWRKVVNDPRYVLQQLKRHRDNQWSSGHDSRGIKRDWAVSLGTGTVAEGMSPAKFTWNIDETLTASSCTNDFAVYGLNIAGTTGGQANLVALNQLYTGTGDDGYCPSYAEAQYYWAYNATTHSGTVTTSPVLSIDGTKVMYIESTASGSYLHILEWYSGDGGTPTVSKAPTNTETHISACPASASCMVTVSLGANADTYSSPYYDYSDDILYVGDNGGILYKVTPVLTGTTAPAVSTLTVSSGNKLTSPVYDSTSGNIFVGGSYNLYAVNASTFALQTHSTLQIGDNSGSCSSGNQLVYDGPIVDGANEWVYEWATTISGGTYTAVTQEHTEGTNSPSGTSWTVTETADVGERDTSCDSGSLFPTWSPTFDNTYYTGTITSGHMWVCGGNSNDTSEAGLWYVPTSGTNGALGSPTFAATQIEDTTDHAVCSPMTEFYNTTTSTDYLFLGEGLVSSFGDLYGFTITDGATPTNTEIGSSPLSTYGSATGGTSAIVVDNVSASAQASSIYFATQLAGSGCTAGDYCAVKLTQSGLD